MQIVQILNKELHDYFGFLDALSIRIYDVLDRLLHIHCTPYLQI